MNGTIKVTDYNATDFDISLSKMEMLVHFKNRKNLVLNIGSNGPIDLYIKSKGKSFPLSVNDYLDLTTIKQLESIETSFSIVFYSDCWLQKDLVLGAGTSIWITPTENNPYDTPIFTHEG